MPDRYKQYRYDISAIFNSNSDDEVSQEPIEIPSTSINNMIINSNYAKAFTPIIWLSLQCPVELLDALVKHSSTGTIILRAERLVVDEEDNSTVLEVGEYIHSEFFYLLTDNRDSLKDAKFEKDSEEDDPDSVYTQKQIIIGLLKKECVDGNKRMVNKIYKNVNVATVLLDNILWRSTIMEPPTNNKLYNQMVIPPTLSINDLVQYIEKTYLIYDTPSIFFSDIDRNYLLSSNGNPVISDGDEIESVFINLNNPAGIDGKIQGGFKDDDKYIVEVDRVDAVFHEDTVVDNQYNNIICIDSEGTPKEYKLDLIANPNSSTKFFIERVRNLEYGNIMKYNVENNSTILKVGKNALDSSIITPNRSFYVYSDDLLDTIYNGQYLLTEKQEMFTRNGEFFENILYMILKKTP